MSDALFIYTRWVKMPSDNDDGFSWWASATIFLDGKEVIARAVRFRGDNKEDAADVTMRTAIAMACNDFDMRCLTDIRRGPSVIGPGTTASPAPRE